MTNLSDTQRILLSAASQRPDGSVLPLPASIAPGGGAAKAINALVKRGFADERQTTNALATHRLDGDLRVGMFINAAGACAIGVGQLEAADADVAPACAAAPAKPRSKAAQVLDLLARPDGATIAELLELTSWLPHTTRAALTGIRKKGHKISRSKRDGATCYRIVSVAR